MTKSLHLKIFFSILLLSLFYGSFTSAQKLVNPNANKETLALKHFLDSIYGKKIISGQAYESVSEKWNEYIFKITGKKPALLSLDFMNSMPYRVSQGANPDTMTNMAIDWVKNKKGMVEMHWHWDAPMNVTGDYYQAFYTKNTSFDLALALSDENSDAYKLLIRDMDTVAGLLKKMQDAGVPVLWRPLHEAEGGWFWWGAKGKDACVKLWNIMYDRFTNHHHLNNLIWVWNSYGTDKGNWYPGDATVDIIAWDYESSNSWTQYQSLFANNGKLLALGEEGKLPDPANFASRPWLYFNTWAYMIDDPATNDKGKSSPTWLKQVYNDPKVLTLDDMIPGPKAYAGSTQILVDANGDGKESVNLDGSASYANSTTDVISKYEWSENNNTIATGVKPTVELSLGTHEISLTVTTTQGLTKTAKVIILVKRVSVAKQKTVKASSSESGSSNFASMAVDGDLSTRWSSAYSDPQWFEVDLGKAYNIEGVMITWEAASGKDYKIEVSNDEISWTTVSTKAGMAAGERIDNIANLTCSGRYVRMSGTARTSNWGYSFYEFEVFGVEKPTAVNDIDADKAEISIYPTIIHENENLHIKLKEAGKFDTLIIYDVNGRKVYQQSLPSNEADIATNGLGKGIFTVKIESKSGITSKKIVIE